MAKRTRNITSKQERPTGSVSLARALSKLGFTSRKLAGELITKGLVRVDERVVKNPHHWVELRTQKIVVEGGTRSATKDRGLMFYKPAGVVTTTADEHGRKTVFDLLGSSGEGLKTVGRLDLDSTGMLLLVTDNRLADALTDPRKGCGKTYRIRTAQDLTAKDEDDLRNGVQIDVRGVPHKTLPANIKKIAPCSFEITLTEGKNRQVKRMIEACGKTVTALHRISIAGLQLDLQQPGTWRELTQRELASLREQTAVPTTKDRASYRFKSR